MGIQTNKHIFKQAQLLSIELNLSLNYRDRQLRTITPLPNTPISSSATLFRACKMSTPPGPSGGAGKPNGVGKAFSQIDLDGHDLPPSPAPSSPRNGRKYALATELVYTESKDQYGASSMPIYQSATFKQTSANGGNEYDYTRSGNPTRTHLERHLAKIMNATRALVVGSGMGALDVITRILRPGDEVITGDDLYGGTNRLLTYMSQNHGIIVRHIDTTNPETVRGVVSPKTAMVLLETPTNPLIKIVDIPSIAKIVHDTNKKALVVVDNTMLSPMLCNPLELGADIVYESGTKYLSGHHDIMAGVLAFNDPAIGDKMYFTINSTGCGLAPNDAFLLMRGIKTLAIRMEKQQMLKESPNSLRRTASVFDTQVSSPTPSTIFTGPWREEQELFCRLRLEM